MGSFSRRPRGVAAYRDVECGSRELDLGLQGGYHPSVSEPIPIAGHRPRKFNSS